MNLFVDKNYFHYLIYFRKSKLVFFLLILIRVLEAPYIKKPVFHVEKL